MLSQNRNYPDKFLRSSNNKPCPICDDRKGKCQISYDDSFVMCMDTHSETSGYRFLGVSKNGIWGMHSLSDVILSEQERLERRYAKEKAERERLETLRKESLPVADRNRAYKAISKELGLSRADRKRLIDRGLTDEQVNNLHSFSLRGYTQISNNIPSNLSGVNIDRNGNKYLYCEDGYFTPAFDFEGNIIGGQTRSNLTNSGNKYKWLKGVKSSHLPNGELPVTFIRGNNQETVNQWLKGLEIEEDLKVIFAVEGLLKPYVASCRFGVDTIGAAGFNFNSGKKQVREIITKGGYNGVILPLDGGVVINPMVMAQLAKNIKIFENLGCKVLIGWWGQFHKADQDFDEIEKIEQVKLIDYDKFTNISKTEIYYQWKRDELDKLRGFKSDKTFNARFIGEVLSPQNFEGKVTAIKAPKGQGKSYFLSTIKKHLESLNIPMMPLFDRNKLKHKLADELGINVIDESLSNDLIESLINVGESIAVTIDSLPRLKKYDLSGYFIIVDEAEQVTESLGISETHIKSVRGMAWGVLDRAIKASKGVLIQDADLSDKTVEYWAKLAPHLIVEKIENVAKPKAKNLYLYSSPKASKKENNKGLNSMLNSLDRTLKQGQKAMLCIDSETQGNALYHQYKDKYKVVYLSAKSIGNNPQLNEYTENKGKKIKDDNVQLLIVTPVLQSGFSIEIDNYFDAVFGYFLGVTTSNILRQILMRYRGDCDRHVWCANYGLGYKSLYDYRVIKAELSENDFITNGIKYFETVESLTTIEATKRVLEILEGGDHSLEVNLENVAKSQARVNLDKSMLLENFIKGSESEGYQVQLSESIERGNVSNLLDDLAKKSDELLTNESILISQSLLIDKWEYDRLSRKATLTDAERAKLARYIIAQRLPNHPITPEFVKAYILKDRYKVINGIQNYYFAQNLEVAKTLDFNSVTSKVRQAENGGLFYCGDLKKYTQLAMLWHELKLEDVRSNGFTNFTARDFKNSITPKLRYALKTQGVSYTAKTSPGTVLSKILGLFGFGIKKVKKSGDTREYTVIERELIKGEVNWLAIYSSIHTRFSVDLNLEKDFYSEMGAFYSDEAQNSNEHSLDSGHHQQFNIEKNNNGVHISKEDTVMDIGDKVPTTPPPPPPPPPDGNVKDNFIGKLCNFIDNNNNISRGIIKRILDFGYEIEDCITQSLNYCDKTQFELLGEV